MPRHQKASFFCSHCGNEDSRWKGFCAVCGANDPLEETPVHALDNRGWIFKTNLEPEELSEISLESEERLQLRSREMNLVLGGGVVLGSVILLAGDPGIGKSTLLLQIATELIAGRFDSVPRKDSRHVLYVSGEESAPQIRIRSDRLGISGQHLFLLGETNIESILSHLEQKPPLALIIDSIQTLYSNEISSSPGSIAQVRECARMLISWAKMRRIPVFLSGHVTKEGDVAGPRILEHMVDVVLYMEGEALGGLRLVRSVKNRFGSSHEVAIFQMEQHGLCQVEDPSKVLLTQRRAATVGSTVIPIMEGSRPVLVEIQALTSPTYSPVPRRVVNGLDLTRVLMLIAILDRRAGLSLARQDIIVNVAGGIRVSEPAVDLGVALAVASSFVGLPLEDNMVVIGEVGLTGEIRLVPQTERRLKEASRLGLKNALVASDPNGKDQFGTDSKIRAVSTLRDAVNQAFPKHGRRQIKE